MAAREVPALAVLSLSSKKCLFQTVVKFFSVGYNLQMCRLYLCEFLECLGGGAGDRAALQT